MKNQNQQQQDKAQVLPDDIGLSEIISALNYLDKQLWPAQNGWSDDMQTAIENLHFHKSQILNCCNEHNQLCKIAEAAGNYWAARRNCKNLVSTDVALANALAALAAIRAQQ